MRDSWFADLRHDVRYALRTLRTSPGFTSVAVLTLALGTGASTAIFSLVDAMLLRPLRSDPSGRLVEVFHTEASSAFFSKEAPSISHMVPSVPTFNEWQTRNQVFDAMALSQPRQLTLIDTSPVERASAMAVSPGFFRLFDASPVIGRTFTDDDANDLVTVISHGCWQRRFGSDARVAGKRIRMLDGSRTVVGVLSSELPYSPSTDFWIPLTTTPVMSRVGWGGSLLARLKPGVTLERAQRHMETVVRQVHEDRGAAPARSGVAVESYHEWTVASSRPMLLILTGAVAFILLIACVNVAGLLVAKGAGRTREIAIRACLGASRLRLARQLLTESSLLAVLGGMAGAMLAWWTLGALTPLLPIRVPSDVQPAIDLRVLGFTLVLSLVTGLVFGVLPAVRVSRAGLTAAIKDGSQSTAQWSRRTGTALVFVEVALALVLLTGAGLMVRSLERVLSIDPGFHPEHVLVVQVSPVLPGDGQTSRARTFYQRLVERVAALPAVEAVGGINTLPFNSTTYSSAELEGAQPGRVQVSPRYTWPGYFNAMGVPLRFGRDFTSADRDGAPCVAIVNETASRKYWAGSSPIGRRVRPVSTSNWCEIVGVAGDVRHQSLERDYLPELYLPALQSEALDLALVVRTSRPSTLAASVRAEVSGLAEPALIQRIVPFEDLIARSIAERRRRAILLGVIGGLGLLLASVGIFGLTAYAVTRRRQEIGIRMALGASSRRVLYTIIGGFAPAIAGGIVLGLFGAWGITRITSQYLFGVTPTDPATLGGVSLLLIGTALLACYLPARRALRVDPVIALRTE